MSLSDKHIFILGAAKFDGPDQSTSFYVAKELAKKNFVYYIDYPFTWKDFLAFKDKDQLKRRISHFSYFSDGIIETDEPKLNIIISPPVLSINFLPEGRLYRKLLKLNELIIRNRIRRIIEKRKIKEFIYINSFNFHYPGIADCLQPILKVYHCVDPMIIPYDMKHGIQSENKLVMDSDLVLCTSRQLYDEKKRLNRKTYFVPNAADIHHSKKALESSLTVHKSISNLKKPIIGYVGSIERRFDFNLLNEMVNKNKDKNFVFAGPISKEFVPDWFYNTPNIHLIGRLPFDEIPNLIKGFDIAIIPFKKDEVSGTIFPLKLFEYLGAGKPVISTGFNSDLEEFTYDTVQFCKDSLSFCRAINDILINDTPEKQRARIKTAEKNTWEQRGIEISDIISNTLIETASVKTKKVLNDRRC